MNERHSLQNIYRANRAAGYTARYSLDIARYIRATLDALDALEVEFVYDGDTVARYTFRDDNAGVTVTYEIERDSQGDPEEYECYDAADLEAWRNDEWHYYGVTVTATMGRFSAEESLWGIDGGDYWESARNPLDAEQQVMAAILEHYPVRAMIEAVQDVAIAACLS